MNKVPVYEVVAPCANTSFEVPSGNSAPASPKSEDAESFSEILRLDSTTEIDELRCNESMRREVSN